MKRYLAVIFLFSYTACLSQAGFSFSDSAVLSSLSRDVHVLASESLAGRKSGTASEQKAYQYITGLFREAGLTPPAGNDSSYLQSFPIESCIVHRDSCTLAIDGLPAEAIQHNGFCPAAYSASGQMAGNRYTLIDLAAYRDDLPPKQGDTGSRLLDSLRGAFAAGRPAVILYNEGSLTRAGINYLYDREKVKPLDGLVVSVNDDIASRLIDHPGVEIIVKASIERTTVTCHNIIGCIDNHAQYTVVIGAHYDHVGVSKRGEVFNGADDNASGTAMLLEMARYLKQSGERSRNYLFIAFSGEEEGLYGSAFFVNHPLVDLKTVDFMLNLDMVGRLGCEGNKVTIFGTGSSPLWKTLYNETPHPRFRVCKMHGVHSFSDHLDFYRRGIPVVSLTTGFHYEYHTTRDDAFTLNYEGMASLAGYLRALLHNTAIAEKACYHKVSGWYNFSANLKIVLKTIDHVLTVGMEN